MARLVWKTKKYVSLDGYQIPQGEHLDDEGVWKAGLRRESAHSLRSKSLVWPAIKLRDDLFVDGFLEWVTGRWIREATNTDTTFLEIGCGDMTMNRFLPSDTCYNAFDLSLSEFHLRRLLRRRPDANVAVASVTDIPLDPGVASLICSMQVLEYVKHVDRALEEIRRVATPGAKFVCSIGNDYSSKYYRGKPRLHTPHPGHVNFWTYQSFVELMASHGFRLSRGRMQGVWVPIRTRLVHASYAFPISAKKETDNTHFLFSFEIEK